MKSTRGRAAGGPSGFNAWLGLARGEHSIPVREWRRHYEELQRFRTFVTQQMRDARRDMPALLGAEPFHLITHLQRGNASEHEEELLGALMEMSDLTRTDRHPLLNDA